MTIKEFTLLFSLQLTPNCRCSEMAVFIIVECRCSCKLMTKWRVVTGSIYEQVSSRRQPNLFTTLDYKAPGKTLPLKICTGFKTGIIFVYSQVDIKYLFNETNKTISNLLR